MGEIDWRARALKLDDERQEFKDALRDVLLRARQLEVYRRLIDGMPRHAKAIDAALRRGKDD